MLTIMFQSKQVRNGWVKKFKELKPEELCKSFPIPTFRSSIPIPLKPTFHSSTSSTNQKLRLVTMFQLQDHVMALESDADSSGIYLVDIADPVSNSCRLVLQLDFPVSCLVSITPQLSLGGFSELQSFCRYSIQEDTASVPPIADLS